ncbi:MAG: hypothetical protein KJ771_07120 [Nanoarchaeota archaeon]|nr:hypothetical protein [Nanoarchaeota archaeon]
MNTEVLEKIGLSKKEIKSYLALLKLKSATVSHISQESRVDRTQTYDILEKLIDKGLCSFVIRNNVKSYSPTNPEQIINDFKEKEKELNILIPQLSSMFQQPTEKVSVEVFKGKEGIKSILKDILRIGKPYYMFGTPQSFENTLPIFSIQFLKQIEKKKIQEKIIFNKRSKFTRLKNSEYRYLSEDILSPTDTLVYGNKVVLFIWTEPYYGILISSKEIAETNKKHFEYFWKQAEPIL